MADRKGCHDHRAHPDHPHGGCARTGPAAPDVEIGGIGTGPGGVRREGSIGRAGPVPTGSTATPYHCRSGWLRTSTPLSTAAPAARSGVVFAVRALRVHPGSNARPRTRRRPDRTGGTCPYEHTRPLLDLPCFHGQVPQSCRGCLTAGPGPERIDQPAQRTTGSLVRPDCRLCTLTQAETPSGTVVSKPGSSTVVDSAGRSWNSQR